jgi:hypothetical protein
MTAMRSRTRTSTTVGRRSDGSRSAVLVLTVVLATVGCTSFEAPRTGPEQERDGPSAADVATSAPDAELAVVADADLVTTAVSMSRALFDAAGLVVLATEGDAGGLLLGAATAVGLGVPLLVEPQSSINGADLVAEELERLGATTVLGVGPAGGMTERRRPEADREAREVVGVPADPAAIEAVTGLDLAPADPVAPGNETSAVAGLDPLSPAALVPEGAEQVPADPDLGTVPRVTRAEPLADTVVLATGEPGSVAGIATARAAGARVVLTGGATDPRAHAETVDALSDAGTVVALGAGFAGEDGLDWKVATATTGEQLPGGGQLLFPGRLLVALYGHPGTAALGVLGEQGLEASIQRARDHAAPYEELVEETVVPTFEIIATVASSAPGEDGDYSAEADAEELRPWVEAAGEAGMYVLLDLQPGRTDFVTQAERYRSLLELPHVGLALDPEWRLGPADVHLTQVGSVGIDEVNRVVTWLADLTREHALPQKLLVLHQFRLAMLPGRELLDTSRDELAVMVHADGQGAQADKQATWRTLRQNPPAPLSWGWKNFYDEDLPMLTPEQTLAQVDPTPSLISYQ